MYRPFIHCVKVKNYAHYFQLFHRKGNNLRLRVGVINVTVFSIIVSWYKDYSNKSFSVSL